jgi:hypothetical protein
MSQGSGGTGSGPIETGRSEDLVHVRYEDLLRAIGHYVDQHGWTDVLITQVPQGVLLKGTVLDQRPTGPLERIAAVMFSNDDIVRMLEENAKRRGNTGKLIPFRR